MYRFMKKHTDSQRSFWLLEEMSTLINYYEQLFKYKQKGPTQDDYNNFILYTIGYKYKYLHFLM